MGGTSTEEIPPEPPDEMAYGQTVNWFRSLTEQQQKEYMQQKESTEIELLRERIEKLKLQGGFYGPEFPATTATTHGTR